MKKILFVVAGLILGIFLFGYSTITNIMKPIQVYESFKNEKPETYPTPLITLGTLKPTINETKPSIDEKTNIENQYKYTSYNLGVSFLYLKEQNGMKFKVDEDSDNERIYLYQDVTYIQNPRKSGQYVEVTRKDKNENLQKALENSILADYPATDCKVSMDLKVSKHVNYEYANIVVAKQYSDLGELMTLLDKCPTPYTASNGLSYFVSPVNGSRFAFLFIGQYGIMSGVDNKGWQDTLEFIE